VASWTVIFSRMAVLQRAGQNCHNAVRPLPHPCYSQTSQTLYGPPHICQCRRTVASPKGRSSIGQSHCSRSHFDVGLFYQCTKGCTPTTSLPLRIVDHAFATSDFELTVLSRRLVSHLPLLKVRGSNLGPKIGNMNWLCYCQKFLNKSSPHPRFPIHFTAPRVTVCLMEVWDQSNDAVFCDHFGTVTTLLHGRPRYRGRFPLVARDFTHRNVPICSWVPHCLLSPGLFCDGDGGTWSWQP